MGHFLEHLLPASASALLSLVGERLPEGAEVSAVVPDMRAIFAAYDAGEISNAELNERFVYSYSQPSRHVWCYDSDALVGCLRRRRIPRRRGDRSADVGAGLLEGRSRGALAVRRCAATVPAPGTIRAGRVRRAGRGVHRGRRARGRRRRAPVAPHPPAPRRDRGTPRRGREYARARRGRARRPDDVRPPARAACADGEGVPHRRQSPATRRPFRHRQPARDACLRRPGPARVEPHRAPRGAHPGLHDVASSPRRGPGHLERPTRALGQSGRPHPGRRGGRRHGQRAGRDPSGEDPRLPARARRGATGGRPWWRRGTRSRVRSTGSRGATSSCSWRPATCCVPTASSRSRRPLGAIPSSISCTGTTTSSIRCAVPVIRSSGPTGHRSTCSARTTSGGRSPSATAAWPPAAGSAPARVTHGTGTFSCARDSNPVRSSRVPRVLSRVGRRPTPNAEESIATVQAELNRRGDGARAVVDRGTVRAIPSATGTPSVSVVIPTRHNRELVGRCLASIRAADYPILEVIIVDNGERTDGERAVVRRDLRRPRPEGRVVDGAVQLLGGQQLRCVARARRGAGVPQRRHRDPRSGAGCASWAAGPCIPGSGVAGAAADRTRRRRSSTVA